MKILIVEDNEEINNMISVFLSKQGFECKSAYSGTEAKLLLEQASFSLIILDLMLPGISGEALIESIHNTIEIPIIVLSAKDSLESKVNVLDSGAADYICKPFELEELLARVQVQLRKISTLSNSLQHKDLTLDSKMHQFKVNEIEITLTKHEYYILELLIRNPKKVFTKKEIYEYAWEETYYSDEKTINTHISNIRKKLREVVSGEYIQTVWGIGFKLY